MTCTNCGKEFKFKETKTRHSYGFAKGKPFCVLLCRKCTKKMSAEEYSKLEYNTSEKIK